MPFPRGQSGVTGIAQVARGGREPAYRGSQGWQPHVSPNSAQGLHGLVEVGTHHGGSRLVVLGHRGSHSHRRQPGSRFLVGRRNGERSDGNEGVQLRGLLRPLGGDETVPELSRDAGKTRRTQHRLELSMVQLLGQEQNRAEKSRTEQAQSENWSRFCWQGRESWIR